VVDIGWSNLADLSIYEGKLLGFSYHDSRVGVWLADISVSFSFFYFKFYFISKFFVYLCFLFFIQQLIGPYALGVKPKASDFTEPIASSFNPVKDELVKPALLNHDLDSKSKSSDKPSMFSFQGKVH
jgi:katanin p80 WD40 repeat-containing subunit B1